MRVYFDETFGPDGSIAGVMGCAVLEAQRPAFEREWARTMAPFDNGIFHASEWKQGKRGRGRFAPSLRDLTRKEIRHVERRLRWLIEEHVAHIVFEAVLTVDYADQVAKRLAPDSRIYVDPYYFCMFSCLGQLQTVKRKGGLPLSPATCLFEERTGPKDTRRIVAHYDRVVASYFQDDFGPKMVLPKAAAEFRLGQATDLVLYETWRELLHVHHGGRADRVWLHRLVNTGRMQEPRMLDPDRFDRFVDAALEEERARQRGEISGEPIPYPARLAT